MLDIPPLSQSEANDLESVDFLVDNCGFDRSIAENIVKRVNGDLEKVMELIKAYGADYQDRIHGSVAGSLFVGSLRVWAEEVGPHAELVLHLAQFRHALKGGNR